MKVELECAACIMHRACIEISEATENPVLRFQALNAILEFMRREFKPTAIPAYLGTKRDRIIKRVTGNQDPYAEKKRISNLNSLKFLPIARETIQRCPSGKSRFRKACLTAIAGNAMEFDLPQHEFKFPMLGELIQKAGKDLVIDETGGAYGKIKTAKKIVYLTDNAGEIAFDRLLVEELKKHGGCVIVAVKEGAVLNDATIEDAETVGIDEVADLVISTGTDIVGMCVEEGSKEFLEAYNSADFVIAKGMGYAETLTEMKLRRPHLLLMRTKCVPVANFFHVALGRNIAKLL